MAAGHPGEVTGIVRTASAVTVGRRRGLRITGRVCAAVEEGCDELPGLGSTGLAVACGPRMIIGGRRLGGNPVRGFTWWCVAKPAHKASPRSAPIGPRARDADAEGSMPRIDRIQYQGARGRPTVQNKPIGKCRHPIVTLPEQPSMP
jgi:hypothetical protein